MKALVETAKIAKTALITGASAGIGAAFAEKLAAEGFHLVLVARREQRLQQLADQLSHKHQIHCHIIAADLSDPQAVQQIVANIAAHGLAIDVLINSAGYSANATFSQSTWSTLAAEMQVMMTALTELCHAVLPHMLQQGYGRIINLSSLAALAPPGESSLYSAIKRYVMDMSQSLDMEVKKHGVHVTALCPGFTHSEFHDVMGTRSAANKLPSVLWQQADAVVLEGWQAVNAGKPVCVTGVVNKVIAASVRPLPQRVQYLLGKTFNPFK